MTPFITPTPYPTIVSQPALTAADAYSSFGTFVSNFGLFDLIMLIAGVTVIVIVATVVVMIGKQRGG